MKALLTSGGISNPTIEAEMWRLLGGKRKGVKLLFITTASNWEGDSMNEWLIKDLIDLDNLGFDIDVCDFAGLPKERWSPRFEWAEVLYFEGGNTGWLKRQITESGLEEELPRLLKDRVWIGASAGSIVLCPTICNSVQDLFDEADFEVAGTVHGLNYVSFDFAPHLNSKYFPRVRSDNIKSALRNLKKTGSRKFFACDDEGAVSVDGDKIKVFTEGEVIEEDLI